MKFHIFKPTIEGNCNDIQLIFVLLWIKIYIIFLVEVLFILYEGSQVIGSENRQKPEYKNGHLNAWTGQISKWLEKPPLMWQWSYTGWGTRASSLKFSMGKIIIMREMLVTILTDCLHCKFTVYLLEKHFLNTYCIWDILSDFWYKGKVVDSWQWTSR